MKHHKSIRTFGRVSRQRKALLNSLARSLVIHERIQTTEAKAKELRPFAERLITYGKKAGLADRRRIGSFVGPDAARKVVDVLAPRFTERSGGYTRIIKCPPRRGDASPLAYIEFVESGLTEK